VQLRPSHAESQRLLRSLQRAAANDTSAKTKEEPEADIAAPVSLPYNPDALGPFITKVQPILMNTCACCHANGKGGSFKLVRGYDEGMQTNRRATQQNLMATLAQLNGKRPHQSALLTLAVTIHGDADKPPLKGKNIPAFHILEEWAQLAVANTPLA